MIRRALVPCAGEGSRLRPLTFSKPKHLLPVAGKPILGWVLESLRAAGITDVGLVVGHHAEAIRRYVGAGSAWDLQVRYIPQLQPLGIGHAVSIGRDLMHDEPFLVYLGDNLFEDGIRGFVEGLDDSGWDAGLLLKRVENPQRFGVAEVRGEHVARVVEKPSAPASDLAIVGVYAFTPAVFDAINKLQPSARGEVEITDAIQVLLDEQREVRWREVHGVWQDAGEPGALLTANQQWLCRADLTVAEGTVTDCRIEGAVGIGEGSEVIGSHLLGPCLIGRNCLIRDATIGPNVSIGEGCEVARARLSNCIIQRNSQVCDLAAGLVDSVLGEQVEVRGLSADEGGTPLSLLLSDMAHIKAM